MAVTISVEELLAALRLGSSAAETAQATRLLSYATTAVTKHVPICPDEIHNEYCIRLCAYLFDAPSAGRGAGFAHALRNSGAAAILLPYRVHRAGSVAEAVQAAQEAVGTTGNPVTDVMVSGSTLTITFADGSTRDEVLPEGGVVGSGRLPPVDVVMRIGWSNKQIVADEIFTREDQHPTDGAAVGTVSGLNPPPFPTALASRSTLFLFVWIAAPVNQVGDLILSGGLGSLIGSGLALAAHTYAGTAGTVWISDLRLAPGLASFSISAVVSGALILTEGDVEPWARTGDATAIPAGLTLIAESTVQSMSRTIGASDGHRGPNYVRRRFCPSSMRARQR